MTQPGTYRYEIRSDDAWEELNHDLAADPSNAYWPLRTFGLEGRVIFTLDKTDLVWGGFLLDLACALAQWIANPGQAQKFTPIEQSNDIDFSPIGPLTRFRCGDFHGTLRTTVAVEMVSGFLSRIASDLAAKAPALLDVSGFDWVREYS